MSNTPKTRNTAYSVYLNGREIDIVFASYDDPEEMHRSLVNHDGYDPRIVAKGPRGKYPEKAR